MEKTQAGQQWVSAHGGKAASAVADGGKPVIAVVAEAEDSPDVCWVCLDQGSAQRPLMHPCKCPTFCHATCIARWQLQSAGTRREYFCDFCNSRLPAWKNVLTPCAGTHMPAVMNVNFDNKTYSFEVSPGDDGYVLFTKAIRKAFRLPDDSELNITFTCDEPSSGSLLTLQGAGAYDAAVHCASVSAARRISSSGSEDSTPGAGSSECGDGTAVEEDVPARPSSGRRSPRGSGSGGSETASGSCSSSSGGGAAHSAGSAGPQQAAGVTGGVQRRVNGSGGSGSFGRKLRSALSDLLALR